MFLVLAPTVFHGHEDSACGDEENWTTPWIDSQYPWWHDDAPERNPEVIGQIFAWCIYRANQIDRRWRRE